MISVTKVTTFDAAHMLAGYAGACENVHGHTYKVEAKLSKGVMGHRMLVDFKELSAELKSILDPLDHAFMFDTGSAEEQEIGAFLASRGKKTKSFPHSTTAEHLALWIAKQLEDLYEAFSIQVTVWETPTSRATVCL